jgi:hypothetical protein
MPWVASDYDYYSQFGYAPNALFAETSYDLFGCRQPPTEDPGSYLTPNSPDMDWTKNAAHSPHTIDSPVTEFSYAEADEDAESSHRSPADSSHASTTTMKRHSAESTRPSKRKCSQASASEANRSPPKGSKERDMPGSTKPRTKSKSSPKDSPGGSHKNQLRTASRKPKLLSGSSMDTEAPDDDDLTTEERRARQSHNQVEKQYRNRLNQQFESLLAVLPTDRRRSSLSSDGKAKGKNEEGINPRIRGGTASIGTEDDDRRLSKAEVLDMARQRIETLEQDCLNLQNERTELMNNMSQVRHAVAKQRLETVGG